MNLKEREFARQHNILHDKFFQLVQETSKVLSTSCTVLEFHRAHPAPGAMLLFELICQHDRIEALFAEFNLQYFFDPSFALWEQLHTHPTHALQWNAHNGFNEPRRA